MDKQIFKSKIDKQLDESLDHFELLNELAHELDLSSEKILQFRDTLTKLVKCRAEIPVPLAKAYVIIELLVRQLSIMPEEWEGAVDTAIEELRKEHVKVEDETYEEFEF